MTKKILQIEDDYRNRTLIDRVLGPHNYELIHAEDGESGIQQAVERLPDLILIDIGLPDIDGHTVLTMLRQVPELGGVPMVALTAWPEDIAREMCQRYGYDGFISKPISVREFPGQIARLMEGQAPAG